MEFVYSAIEAVPWGGRKLLEPVIKAGQHLCDHFIPHARNNYHPHMLGHRALALFSGLLVAVKIFTLTAATLAPVIPAFSSAITVENIISLTNASRSEMQLSSLAENNILDKAAQAKADDMLAKGYFSHNTPDGKTPWDFIVAAGYNYLSAGENLAVNFTEAESVEQAWMNSPGHRANIVNRNYEEIGIGIAQGQYQGHEAIFVVQMFGTPAEQKIILSKTPTPVQTAPVPPPIPATVKSVPVTPAVAAAPATPSGITELAVNDGSVRVDNNNAVVEAHIGGEAVKVLAYFGQQSIWLAPTSQSGVWRGTVPLSDLVDGQKTLVIKASDMAGRTVAMQLADFSGSTPTNYQPSAGTQVSRVAVLGASVNVHAFEQRFYLLFLAGLLSSLVLAIAIKRHVQHLSLIANTSFVAIFACLLWMAG